MEAYSATLNQHKELIKKNTFARELEKKYHKIRHQHLKPSQKLKKKIKLQYQSLWPIESKVFTDVLRSKLSESTKPRSFQAPSSRLIESNARYIKRLSADSAQLPKLRFNRFWSPPKHGESSSLLFDANPKKLFGPNVNQVRYSIKNLN
ncbi:hypothetical protein SteCoe_8395 [Stentor coeruleus]|uniref:Uncharacterized protein n=1 Tax=Stentor coeruleus TaxID=5963 RepID=A0A1R2CKM0_9CILI|nr:hypothetical protein SteCoe_8395 [Stentor coeruleus]